jgi:uncharacterized protein YbaP (TraB family)
MARWLVAPIAAILCACGGAPPACPMPPAAAPGAPLLWRAERGAGVVWLYGTIHDAGADDVLPAVWKRLDAAPRFASELGGDAPDPAQLTALARLPWGRVLDAELPADDWWELVDAMLGAMTEDELRHARPWLALVRLRAHMANPPKPSMDDALAARAAERGAPVDALESWRDQLTALDAAVGARELSQAIHARKAVACEVARLRAAYRASDLPALTAMLLDPLRGDPLLVERNRRWLAQIERYLDGDGGFVAVGLGHLLGDHGLPALLARDGAHVTSAW